jgi:NADP-dependent alcohol dehydrogenase
LRNQLSHKKAKLEQMGRNVFGLADSEDLAELTIQAIEALYHSVDVATQLTEHGTDKNAAVEAVIKQLKKHGLLKIGEHQAITLENSKAILEAAVA